MFWFVRRALRALRAPLRRPLEPLLWLAAALSAKDAWVRAPPAPEPRASASNASARVRVSGAVVVLQRSPSRSRSPPRRSRARPSPANPTTPISKREPQALPSTARARRPGEGLPAGDAGSESTSGRAGLNRKKVQSSDSRRADGDARWRGGAPLLIILAQAKLDGTRWQVVPAYLCTVTCTGLNALGRVKGVRLPKTVCRLVALAGAAGAAVSTIAGVFAPVFPMPKPTGPYRVGKTTRLWIDRNRRSWLLKTKRKLGAQALPEHRMMMVNIWYPARREDDGSEKDSQPPWPADEEAEARFAERAAGFSKEDANATPRRVCVLKKQREETAKHQARYEKRRAEAKKSGRRRRAHWLDPTLATTLAESFYLPGWVVDYFRLVKMDAVEDAPVADPPRVLVVKNDAETETFSNGFPVVLFSHSFTGVKEQNSALLQEIASWGHIVVAVDHPHDAALVLYPDGSTADFRGYDMPKESEPRNWWRFRHEHARWRALDLAHALERTVELSFDDDSPLRGKIDLSRVACVGHSFGGAAAVMLAQMDPRITSVVALDPWMWPLGRETAMAGCPCPLLVFEAPEFMWNRDIFCVTNGETSSLMCAATAPQAVGREKKESGREEEETAEVRAEERLGLETKKPRSARETLRRSRSRSRARRRTIPRRNRTSRRDRTTFISRRTPRSPPPVFWATPWTATPASGSTTNTGTTTPVTRPRARRRIDEARTSDRSTRASGRARTWRR